ncbi:MAG: preprotein translocase subunit YajC [Salibacteraceae bacterium]
MIITILQAQGGGYQTLIMFGLIALVMYFFMIRPQMKKSKEQKKFRAAISKGDKIVTIGGIHGRIKDVNETTVMIETDGGAKMRIEKSAISLDFSSGKGEEAAAEIEQNK